MAVRKKTPKVKGVSVSGLTKRQQTTMRRHSAHHTRKHLRVMATAMRKGRSFGAAHRLAMRKVGK